ncbi:tRNA/tmRNA (uracil-C(5))-methyltransferase (tRNA (uracil(54)-C(5))-methyltransferase) (tRNA(m5U54)-methyltransferase) (RUMT) (tmRNA (uracil(341)-C(5))-methyltransferase) [Durusdinium trenchii]|uniref:tRNA/tmRNA (Uracil-C(5))-methyltransferase (tRNA (uracil(54)-C(5))-methyltransferase) (tRNA(m5U54)-methyltransferase) (RUMT) (tmRNA (uracil(341)-C(5))-methyltransferase) n=1 Tax=Durusdinium trenchii TaxID=1381693 RepID=A0ABP0PYX3_9DINO
MDSYCSKLGRFDWLVPGKTWDVLVGYGDLKRRSSVFPSDMEGGEARRGAVADLQAGQRFLRTFSADRVPAPPSPSQLSIEVLGACWGPQTINAADEAVTRGGQCHMNFRMNLQNWVPLFIRPEMLVSGIGKRIGGEGRPGNRGGEMGVNGGELDEEVKSEERTKQQREYLEKLPWLPGGEAFFQRFVSRVKEKVKGEKVKTHWPIHSGSSCFSFVAGCPGPATATATNSAVRLDALCLDVQEKRFIQPIIVEAHGRSATEVVAHRLVAADEREAEQVNQISLVESPRKASDQVKPLQGIKLLFGARSFAIQTACVGLQLRHRSAWTRVAAEAHGLGSSRFQRRQKRFGPNPVPEPRPRCPPLTPPDLNGYQVDLQQKVDLVQDLLADLSDVTLDVVPSPELLHYRHRVRFGLRHGEEEALDWSVVDPESGEWIVVKAYPLASVRINRLMSELREALAQEKRLRWKAFEVELLSNTKGEALALIMYHRRLDPEDDLPRAQALAKELDAKVVLRAKGQRMAGRNSFLVQENEVAGRRYSQRLLESSFFQANLRLNQQMQSWVTGELTDLAASGGDLLEIYCGNGNFTLPAADAWRTGQVLATELDRLSLAGAEACAKEAGIENLVFRKCMAEAMNLQKLRPLGLQGPYEFSTLLLDPPRAGLNDRTRKMAESFDHVIYISCNPRALLRDLQLMKTHRIEKACLFDQFPWTDHAEVAVRLFRLGASG